MKRADFENLLKAAIRADKYPASRDRSFQAVMLAFDEMQLRYDVCAEFSKRQAKQLEDALFTGGAYKGAIGAAGEKIKDLREEVIEAKWGAE